MLRTISLATLVLAGAPAFAADDCKNPETQLAMNQCAYKEYQAVDARLNRTWKDVTAKIDEPKRLEQLKEVQRAWLKFRDLQCDFDADAYMGGSIMPLIRASCLTTLTKQRVKDLRAMLEEGGM